MRLLKLVPLLLAFTACLTAPTPLAHSMLPNLEGPRGALVVSNGSLSCLAEVRTVSVVAIPSTRTDSRAVQALRRGLPSALPNAVLRGNDADLLITYRSSYNVLCLDACTPNDYLPEFAVVELSCPRCGLQATWREGTNWASETRLPSLFPRALRKATNRALPNMPLQPTVTRPPSGAAAPRAGSRQRLNAGR